MQLGVGWSGMWVGFCGMWFELKVAEGLWVELGVGRMGWSGME